MTELDDLVELPETMSYVWLYFIELHNSRTTSGFGINPISYADMYAYFRLIDVNPFEWEVRTIKKLDNIAIECYNEEAEKQQNKAKAKSKK